MTSKRILLLVVTAFACLGSVLAAGEDLRRLLPYMALAAVVGAALISVMSLYWRGRTSTVERRTRGRWPAVIGTAVGVVAAGMLRDAVDEAASTLFLAFVVGFFLGVLVLTWNRPYLDM